MLSLGRSSIFCACVAFAAVAPLLIISVASSESPRHEYRLGPIVQLAEESRSSSRIEFAFEVKDFPGNPFDPAQIDVSVDFAGPMGRRLAVPGFWSQPFSRNGHAAFTSDIALLVEPGE